MTHEHHYIDGQWVSGRGTTMDCTDPATGEVTWSGQSVSDDQVEQAVHAARNAFERWAHTTLDHRIDLIKRFGQQLSDHQASLAVTISRDTGKPLWESKTEVNAMIGKIDLSIRAYQDRCQTIHRDLKGTKGVLQFKPHGACAVFGPFNLPGHLPNGHMIPALLAGNTVVFKPSELTAAVGHHMMQLWDTAELPSGVINMVQGARETGKMLANSSGLDGLFFTGSNATGVALSRVFADQPQKILALEMGGNNPLVVWDAQDLDAAAYLTIQSAFITAGQRCTCARRLIVPDDSASQPFLDHLIAMIESIRIGTYIDRPEPFIGPVISQLAASEMLDAQMRLIKQGGKSIVELTRSPECPALLRPGLIDVTGISNRSDEELFGPLLQVIRVAHFDEALDEANNTAYGLSAALFSDDQKLYEAFSQRIRAGVVNWNRQTTGASGTMPFGGVGASGNHRPAGYWAADYCCYPVASMQTAKLSMPTQISPGLIP